MSILVRTSQRVFDLPVLLLLAAEADLDVFVPPEPVPPLLLEPDPQVEPPLLPPLPCDLDVDVEDELGEDFLL